MINEIKKVVESLTIDNEKTLLKFKCKSYILITEDSIIIRSYLDEYTKTYTKKEILDATIKYEKIEKTERQMVNVKTENDELTKREKEVVVDSWIDLHISTKDKCYYQFRFDNLSINDTDEALYYGGLIYALILKKSSPRRTNQF